MSPHKLENQIKLPEIHDAVVEHVVDWLRSEKAMQRPPEAAAKLLILLVKLNRDHTPLPTRAAIARHLDIAIPTVDIVISNRIATGHLKLVVETIRGQVKQRLTVVQHKHLVPSTELQAVVEAGEDKWKMLTANQRRREARRRIKDSVDGDS
jgi:hypothetical protein